MDIVRFAVAAAAATVAINAGEAKADPELRVGLFAHNVRVTNAKNANKEPGPDVELEYVFSAPRILSWVGGPHPYALANINTQGQTSYAAGGLEWQWEFARGWKLEPGVGFVIHNGKLDNPYANGTPQAAAYQNAHVLLGSRELFHSQVGVAHTLSAHWVGELVYEHMSNGEILHHGRNQGLDEVGLRLGYRFGR